MYAIAIQARPNSGTGTQEDFRAAVTAEVMTSALATVKAIDAGHLWFVCCVYMPCVVAAMHVCSRLLM